MEDRVTESLKRLKDMEKPRGYKSPVIVKDIHRVSEPIKTIQQNKVKDIMSSLDNMERKMKSNTNNYLSMYYDLLKLEKKFLNAISEMEKSDAKVPELFAAEIYRKKSKIESKHSRLPDYATNELK